MTDLRQAAQQALEALEGWEHCDKWVWPVTALEQAKRNTTESLAALRTALEQQQAEPVFENLDYVAVVYSPSNAMLKSPLPIGTHLYKYPPQQQAEPICPECKAAVLYECVACSSNNYPPQQQSEPVASYKVTVIDDQHPDGVPLEQWGKKQMVWDKPSASFNAWWDSEYDDSANRFEKDSAAYWAWAGWQAAQRPWVGLTDEEIDDIYWGAGKHDLLDARAIEAKLKERNNG